MKLILLFLTFFSSVCFAEILTISISDLPKLRDENLQIKSLEFKYQTQQQNMSSARSTYYPQIHLVGGMGEEVKLAESNKGQIGFIQASWNLYRGGTDSVNVELAQLNLRAAALEFSQKKRDVLLQGRALFYLLLKLNKSQNMYAEELETTRTQKQMAAKKVAAGLSTSVDVLEFELREDFIQNKLLEISTERDRIEAEFRMQFSISENVKLELRGDFPKELSPLKASLAADRTAIYQLEVVELEKRQLEKSSAIGDFLPRLDLEASFGRLTYQNFSENRDQEKSVGLRLTIPLFSGFGGLSKYRASLAAIEEKTKSAMLKLNSIAFDIKNLQLDFARLNKMDEINTARLVRAQKYYEMTVNEYRRGVKNSPDLVTATERYFEIRRDSIEVKANVQSALAKLEQLTATD